MENPASPPWKRKPATPRHDRVALTPESIAWAKARARRAGRRYPNLVDNMAAARRQREPQAGGNAATDWRGLRDGPV